MNTSNITSSDNKLGELISANSINLFGNDEGFWKIHSSLNNGRQNHSATGIASSCMVQGGNTADYKYFNNTETYNGSIWKTDSALMTIKSSGHTATGNINTIYIQGNNAMLEHTEYYNGSTWSNGALLNLTLINRTATGTATNCMVQAGGYMSISTDTESYNGSIWSVNSSKLNIGRKTHSASGNTNNISVHGGYNGGCLDSIEYYNGSVWLINSGKLNATIYRQSATGTSNNCMIQGGDFINSGISNKTEIFNGNICILNTVRLNYTRYDHSATGTASNCMIQGNGNSDTYITTEIYNI